MGLFTSFAVFLTIWWTVLFAVLPFGSKSYREAGVEPGPGVDPGSPVNPQLKQKFLLTTAVAAVLFIAFWTVITLDLIRLPPLR
jgi:predicted secreted protein